MSMPKGHKSAHGYATVTSIESGMDYRSIADTMTESGFKMNHATARNIFLRAMKKMASEVHELYELPTGEDDIMKTAKDPRFQECLFEFLDEIDI